MNKEKLVSNIRLFFAPVALIILGAVLLFNPDSASAMISKVLGGLLVAVGIGIGFAAIGDRSGQVGKGIAAVALVLAGGWLTRNPLALAAGSDV